MNKREEPIKQEPAISTTSDSFTNTIFLNNLQDKEIY